MDETTKIPLNEAEYTIIRSLRRLKRLRELSGPEVITTNEEGMLAKRIGLAVGMTPEEAERWTLVPYWQTANYEAREKVKARHGEDNVVAFPDPDCGSGRGEG